VTLAWTALTTPIGALVLAFDHRERLCAASFGDGPLALLRALGPRALNAALVPTRAPARIADPLHAYFGGDVDALDRVPIELLGTPFQRRVWRALRLIPAGTTRSYGELAGSIGSGARAVGHANGRNRIAIVVPCHRLIGADGTLTGYEGGLDRKRWLLSHEGATPSTSAR